MEEEKKTNKSLIIGGFIFLIIVIIVLLVLLLLKTNNKDTQNNLEIEEIKEKNQEIKVDTNDNNESKLDIEENSELKKDEEEDSIKEETTNSKVETNKKVNKITKINEAMVNGVKVSFPATKKSFSGTNLEWDEKYAKNDLASNYTTSGGRIGKYPGGIVVSVINNSKETKHIEDCIIDSATFYFDKESNDDFSFIGGINAESTKDTIKEIMEFYGFKNGQLKDIDDSSYYKYYKDDDKSNYKDYIEFSFYKGELKDISISSRVQ